MWHLNTPKWLKSVHRWPAGAHFPSFIRNSERYPSVDGLSHNGTITARRHFYHQCGKTHNSEKQGWYLFDRRRESWPWGAPLLRNLEFRDSFIRLRVTAEAVAVTTRCKPWVGGRGGGKKRDGDGGWGKNRREKTQPTLVSEQFMGTVCQVARWIPPGHYRFRRRANSEMESAPVISAQTHSAWWAQMRVSKASHVWNEGGGGYKN